MSTKHQLLTALKFSKSYRYGFLEESIKCLLTAQISTMRQERGWDMRTFAGELGRPLSWVYRLEDPNATVPTVNTLLHVASALDVGLDVRFRSFSEIVEAAASLTPQSFLVPSFESELSNAPAYCRDCGLAILDPAAQLCQACWAKKRNVYGQSQVGG